MAQTFLIFDFGTDEEAAQRARHNVEGWRQGFRLDRKMLLKFDRQDTEQAAGEQGGEKAGGKKTKAAALENEGPQGSIVLMVRLDFSDHERLSHQRWVERIPGEAAFKPAKGRIIRPGDADFEKAAEKFDTLP